MLSKPNSGWTCFKINNSREYWLGFLTDIPMEWLDACIKSILSDRPIIVEGELEPGYFSLMVNDYRSYVITVDEYNYPNDFTSEHIMIGKLEFCKNLCKKIREYIDEWTLFDEASFDPEDGEEAIKKAISKRKRSLFRKVKKLEYLIERKENINNQHV